MNVGRNRAIMRISRSLRRNDHAIRLVVTHLLHGWNVRQHEDGRTVSDAVYTDWHRVERALSAFDRKAEGLRNEGWIDHAEQMWA